MNEKYNNLFVDYVLNNGVKIENRLVVAPMTLFAANDDGTFSDEEIKFMENRGKNVGMFILEATLVSKNGKAFIKQPEAVEESQFESLKKVAELLKNQGTKPILQLHHGGKVAIIEDKVGPSADAQAGNRELSNDEILKLIEDFANATDLAIRAGFSGVEIHGANGYLIQQFYSGESNKRDDEWGGTREKRMKFPLEVIDAVVRMKKRHNYNDFIIGYRFSPEEAEENGLTMEDTFALIDKLKEKPLQYLHVSLHDFNKKARRGADTNLTRMQLISERVDKKLPIIGVGNLFTADDIANAFETGWADFIALGKTVMINPEIATLIKEGKEDEIENSLDPEKEEKYGIPNLLWNMCLTNSPWLPPLKDAEWKPLDI